MYMLGLIVWKLLVWSVYLIWFFCLFAWLTLVAFGKVIAAIWKLVSAGSKALEHKVESESLQSPVEDAKPPIKAQPGPRDYNLPE